MTMREMRDRGWDQLDFLCVTGDAYVDHPSFGCAIIARIVESLGFRVGVISQPDWRSTEDLASLGRPRLGVFVGAGNLDSMLSNYSTRTKRRRRDSYSPNGEAGHRPDRATIVYCNRIREIWKDIPLVIGGIEASLRRLAHYDWWSDQVRRSILVDSRADLIAYGMAELQTAEIVRRLADGARAEELRGIAGTCWKTHSISDASDSIVLSSFEKVKDDKVEYARAFKIARAEENHRCGRRLAQDQGAWIVVAEPPARPLTMTEMDRVYDLPYTREAHPSYQGADIPATKEVSFSITSHRGCFGECAFCAIASHQGRVIQARSVESIVREAKKIASHKDFKGYIHDVGGPSANFRVPACDRCAESGACKGKSCLHPEPCEHLKSDHSDYLKVLRAVERVPGVKKVFVRSGVRYDHILRAKDGKTFLRELCERHVSGQLKIAPEHASDAVLFAMRKGRVADIEKFFKMFYDTVRELKLELFLVPYLMASHPGCGVKEAAELAVFIHRHRFRPEQVQDFAPTPGSLATCMYYTGIDPYTEEPIHVARDDRERAMQRALMQYWMPENRRLVEEALRKIGRSDLAAVLFGSGRKQKEKDLRKDKDHSKDKKPTRRSR